jgi:hypothetical protein
MRRLHLFEFEDFDWYPRALRDMETDLLHLAISKLGVYEPAVPHIARLLERSKQDRVIDLCSGGAGPWPELLDVIERTVGRPVRVTLTDKFPNLVAFQEARVRSGRRIDFVETSVDATRVPAELRGVRTIFTAFHHFPPELARAIVRDAFEQKTPIAIFESTARTPHSALLTAFSPLIAMAITPFVRPFRLKRLVWTYAVPVVPLVAGWNGVVSTLRTYSPEELAELVAELRSNDYVWETGREPPKVGLPPMTYLVGYPM